MRSHGVTSFPDPNASGQFGGISAGSGIDPSSPTFQAAQQACQKYMPAGNATPAQQAQRQAQLLKHAKCMRSHGVTNYPDPGSNSVSGIGPNEGINPQSSTYKAALSACQSLLRGGSSSSGS
jgi:hypothetical protein